MSAVRQVVMPTLGRPWAETFRQVGGKVGKHEMGVCKERVSQIIARALGIMRRKETDEAIELPIQHETHRAALPAAAPIVDQEKAMADFSIVDREKAMADFYTHLGQLAAIVGHLKGKHGTEGHT